MAFVVNSLADNTTHDGLITLREALLASNANATVGDAAYIGPGGPDGISFDPALFATPQTINLALGELPITDGVTITGPANRVTIDAHRASRVFNVWNLGTPFSVEMSGLTITAGVSPAPFDGGGIVNSQFLTVRNCKIVGNSAQFGEQHRQRQRRSLRRWH
jgi:hypothetical protein